MRIFVPCAVCVKKRSNKDPIKMIPGELDGGVIFVTCAEGHKTAVLYRTRRYKLLLESGARALIDGYANESIASFSTAVERAYEFYLRVIFRSKGIPKETFEAAWKDVTVQSERQYGAFHMLFLMENKTVLKLNPDIPRMRNRIIHQGQMAKEEDAITFGRLVFERVIEIENALKANQSFADDEEKSEIEMQKVSIPIGIESMVLEVIPALVDNNNQSRVPENFSEFLSTVVHKMKEEDRIS